MKIGIFDSGLGGLILARSIIKKLFKYDYIYLGDTKRVPYGGRSKKTVYEFTKEAVDFLFKKNCQVIIVACNTASALALRKIQKEYLAKNYPNRRVLGVIIPTLEETAKNNEVKKVGVLATLGTINSHIYKKELGKINKNVKIYEQQAPLLVSLIENGGLKYVNEILGDYLKSLKAKKVQEIVLGCTHYPILKNKIKKLVGKNVKVLSQDEIIPKKLAEYFKRHPEIEKKLSKRKKREFLVTDVNQNLKDVSKKLFGKSVKFKPVKI